MLLTTTATLSEAGVSPTSDSNFSGSVYVATPQLLATYGIKASQIGPHTDFLTSRPGLAGLPHMQMIWQAGNGSEPDGSQPAAIGGQSCTPSNDCLASPAMQTVSNLPSGFSAPNTVLTEHAVRKYHLQTQLSGWLIQAPAPLTATQIQAARQVHSPPGAARDRLRRPGTRRDRRRGTALGIIIALGVLAASVGLIRSEAAPDLRTLTAPVPVPSPGGDHRGDRGRAGPAGAVLGMAFALVTSLVWAHASLSALFGEVPVADVLILLMDCRWSPRRAAGWWPAASRR